MPSLTRPVLGVKHSTTELCVFCSFYALRGSTTLFNKWFESKTKSEGHKSMLAVVSRSVKSRGRVVHDCQNEIKSRVVDSRRSIVPQYTPPSVLLANLSCYSFSRHSLFSSILLSLLCSRSSAVSLLPYTPAWTVLGATMVCLTPFLLDHHVAS